MLKELAFVYHLTRRVKASLGEEDHPLHANTSA
jgi:hypothetical protein